MEIDSDRMQAAAGEALKYFTQITRNDGKTVDVTTRDAPEWILDMMREVHNKSEIPPDDVLYEQAREALDYIHDNGHSEDRSNEFADSSTPIYGCDIVAWLSHHPTRHAILVDEAADEFGPAEDLMKAIQQGIYCQLQQTYTSVAAALEAHAQEQEEAE